LVELISYSTREEALITQGVLNNAGISSSLKFDDIMGMNSGFSTAKIFVKPDDIQKAKNILKKSSSQNLPPEAYLKKISFFEKTGIVYRKLIIAIGLFIAISLWLFHFIMLLTNQIHQKLTSEEIWNSIGTLIAIPLMVFLFQKLFSIFENFLEEKFNIK